MEQVFRTRSNAIIIAGFALPTILIASFVMLVVLVTAAATVSSLRANLNTQYYNQLASEAAESGVNYAISCLTTNNYNVPWASAGRDLLPNTDCNGVTISGADTMVISKPDIQSRFTVTGAETDGTHTKLTVVGVVERLRKADDKVWQSYTKTLNQSILNTSLMATTSASGRYQVCGILSGKLWCWGNNESGQLGNGTTVASIKPVQTKRSGALSRSYDTDVAVGDSNVCIVSGGEVWCWGKNTQGQLGVGTTDSGPHSLPSKVAQDTGLSGKRVTQVVTNGNTNCVLANGDVYCWGIGQYGILGNGSSSRVTKPTLVDGIGAHAGKVVTEIAGNPVAHHVCAVADGGAYCWGRNTVGQLGDGSTSDRYRPVAVSTGGALSGKTIVGIALSGSWPLMPEWSGTTTAGQLRATSCMRTSDGDMYCWGSNQFGQLGQGFSSTSFQTSPVKVNGLLASKNVSKIALSYGTACALADNNVVYCWGFNREGQAGDGTAYQRESPTAIAVRTPGIAGKTVTNLTAGVNRSCVVADGSTYCWGQNDNGQIGDGTKNNNRLVPTEAYFLRQPPTSFGF